MKNRYATNRIIAAILMPCLCLSACAAPAGTAVDVAPAPLSSVTPASPTTNAAASPSPEIIVQNEHTPAPKTVISPLPTEQPSPTPAPQTPEPVINETPDMQPSSQDASKGDNTNMEELLQQLQTLTPGVDYAENELLSSFSTEDEAQDFAARFGLELVIYTQDFTLLRSSEPLLDAVQRMMAASSKLPVLSLNYRRTSGVS